MERILIVFETSYKGKSAEGAVKELFRRSGMSDKEDDIAESLATVLLGRVRKRYRNQENPDGSKWKTSAAAEKRAAGKSTRAKGGKYAPGGMKTGGFTLFSSGNMFQSITLKKKSKGTYSIQSDVPYAVYYMNKKYTIIGTTENEVDELIKAALGRMT